MTEKNKKFYYLIEDLDVTDDNIPDGVLVRQYKINKKNKTYYYTKNSYITEDKLKEIINDVVIPSTSDKKLMKTILLSNAKINKIRNKHLSFDEIPRIIISKKSYFAHIIKNKNINISKLLKDLNKIIS